MDKIWVSRRKISDSYMELYSENSKPSIFSIFLPLNWDFTYSTMIWHGRQSKCMFACWIFWIQLHIGIWNFPPTYSNFVHKFHIIFLDSKLCHYYWPIQKTLNKLWKVWINVINRTRYKESEKGMEILHSRKLFYCYG